MRLFAAILASPRAFPPRKLAAVAGVVAAGSYVLLAGAEVPAVRTFAMLAIAACGLWWGRPGTAGIVWLWALAARAALGPMGDVDSGFLAVLRSRRAAAVRVHRPPARRARRRVRCAPARYVPRWRACAVGRDAGVGAHDAGPVPAGVADRTRCQRRCHSGRHAWRRAARIDWHRGAGRRCCFRRRTRCWRC